MDQKKAVMAFRNHKYAARRRGIDFQFNFDEWCQWWRSNLGDDWLLRRGRKQTQFVMARKGDKGPYHPSNVKCIRAAQNIMEQAHPTTPYRLPKPLKNGRRQYSKLNASIALDIFKAKGTQRSIAVKYDVSERLVRMIKAKQVWKHAIDESEGSA